LPRFTHVILALCALALSSMGLGTQAVASPVGNFNVPAPAKPVDIDRYVGRYYELARYENIFQRGCEAVSADYSKIPGGMVRIVNICHDKGMDGPPRSVNGRAKLVEGSRNAKFKVSFLGPAFLGDYWVLDRAEDYSWAIVSDRTGKFLWLLHRQPTPGPAEIAFLVNRAKTLGFNTALLRFTKQAPLAKSEAAR
jgi:apolipoprotein D and lipocalin family protein